MITYKLHIFGHNGEYERTEKFDNESDFEFAYAEYCGCEYRSNVIDRFTANIYPPVSTGDVE